MPNHVGPESFQPENDLERILAEAKIGSVSIEDCLQQLVQSELCILSKGEVMPDGTGFVPLLLDRDGVPMVAVFTSLSRATLHSDRAKFCLSMKGNELLLRMPQGYGIVVNPGYFVRLEILPEGIRKILGKDKRNTN